MGRHHSREEAAVGTVRMECEVGQSSMTKYGGDVVVQG